MKSFKASRWDSDDEDHSYHQLFKESLNTKKDRSKLLVADERKQQRKFKKLLKKQMQDFKSNDVKVITVQTKIALGKTQKKRNDSSNESYDTFKKEKKLRKKCKKSKAELTSDSEDSEGKITKKQKRMLKRYSSELNNLNNNSDKLNKELLAERKRQKKLKKKLEKAAKKQLLLNKAIDTRVKEKFENFSVRKIKTEPIDSPGKSNTSSSSGNIKIKQEREETCSNTGNIKIKQERDTTSSNSGNIKIKQKREKITNPINIPESLKIIKKIKLHEKLRTILSQVEKRENKPIMTLRQKMMEKLKAARFRFLNEQIYTTDSKEAQRIFKSDPEAFFAYHEGYRQQVKSWPMNPLDVIIKTIKNMPKTHIVADFGCGDAKLAKSVEQKVHSFDLIAIDKTVMACDMAKVPLKDASVDVAVFCLSLMGTNLQDYLLEANRVLKLGGILKIAEVESRFDNVENFIEGVQRFGFRKTWKDLSHNLFYFMDFRKVNNNKNKKKLPTISLLPCLYKKR